MGTRRRRGKQMNFIFDIGLGYPTYLAHLTIGIGRHTLWFTISANNWNKIQARKKIDRFTQAGACLSIFTVTYTN